MKSKISLIGAGLLLSSFLLSLFYSEYMSESIEEAIEIEVYAHLRQVIYIIQEHYSITNDELRFYELSVISDHRDLTSEEAKWRAEFFMLVADDRVRSFMLIEKGRLIRPVIEYTYKNRPIGMDRKEISQ